MIKAIFGEGPGIFLICPIAWTLTNMDQALFGFAVPGMLAEFGLSLQAVGLILTISFAAAALLVIPAGIAADRFGCGATLCVLLAVSAVMVGMQGFAGSVVALTLFRALGFGFSSGLSPVTNALRSAHLSRGWRTWPGCASSIARWSGVSPPGCASRIPNVRPTNGVRWGLT